MGNRKYILTDETRKVEDRILHKIKAVKDFNGVHEGDLGGWVESEDNLSQFGNCWIYDNAMVLDEAIVSDMAMVRNRAKVSENAFIHEHAWICDNAWICGDANVCHNATICDYAIVKNEEDYTVYKNIWGGGHYFTWTRSNNMWKDHDFFGTGEELIKKAYKDSKLTGECYEAIVKAQEIISKNLDL